MQILNRIVLVLLVVISFVAGVPKILQMPQELQFLAHLGISGIAVTLLGVLQFSAGILLLPQKTRLIGAILAELGLLVSAVALLTGGNLAMGFISFVPVALANWVIFLNLPRSHNPRSES